MEKLYFDHSRKKKPARLTLALSFALAQLILTPPSEGQYRQAQEQQKRILVAEYNQLGPRMSDARFALMEKMLKDSISISASASTVFCAHGGGTSATGSAGAGALGSTRRTASKDKGSPHLLAFDCLCL